jgi:sigma-E factor negative regulatory protein RseA
MSDRWMDDSVSREDVSALVDGELDGAGASAVFAAWRSNPAMRRDWHTWQLVGDVLRSEDLATEPARDARFLAAVQERLAREPVVLAPAPSAAAAPLSARPSRWVVPSAIAAGIALVVGVLGLVQPGAWTAPSSAPLADAGTGSQATAPVAAASPTPAPTEPQTAVVADGKLIRDARLDRYLAAHKQFAGTSALGVPSTFLRSATVESAVGR